MDSLWPWLALAGLGALHGLNPACGWLQAAASGLQAGDHRQALRSLLLVALGHGLSVMLVAGAVASGLTMDGQWLQWPAGALLMLIVTVHLRRSAGGRCGHFINKLAGKRFGDRIGKRSGSGSGSGIRKRSDKPVCRRVADPSNGHARPTPGRAAQASIAISSFMVSTAHGAGLMLVPALVPLCLSNSPARQITASGSLLLALAAVLVHMVAMLAVTALLAASACHGASRLAKVCLRMPRINTASASLRRLGR